MENKHVFKKPTGDRSLDLVLFQKAFIPSYKQLFKAMMCDVLAHADVNNASHYVVRRPYWHEGVKNFQYGYLYIPYSSKTGKWTYQKMAESESFWDDCYEIYIHLKEQMFDSLENKESAGYILKDIYRECKDSWKDGDSTLLDFAQKGLAALDKK